MGYLGRRIGLSQGSGNSTPEGADGAVGGGLLDLFASGYFQREGNIYNAPGLREEGIVATGGVISDYTSGSDVFRAHIFTSSGELNVTNTGTLGAQADFLVVGGGGAGGSDPGNNGAAGGGGAGGYRSSTPEGPGGPSPSAESQLTLSVQTYPVTVGGGGAATSSPGVPGSPGNPSIFSTITSQGGGGGGAAHVSTAPFNGNGRPGGSGGGAGSQSTSSQTAGTGSRVVDPDGPAPTQGYPGGLGHTSSVGPNTQRSGGGGGAGAAGYNANPPVSPPSANGAGGAGKTSTISGTSTNYAGGGTASNDSDNVPISNNPGAPFGGGSSENVGGSRVGTAGEYATGGGGCGNGNDGDPSPSALGGTGGSGVVIVRYKIATTETQTAKATGGAISFYGGKTIHTFTGSGTFATAPNWSSATVEYVVVGGGGGGGMDGFGGGGGAGAYRTGTTPIGAHPVSTTVQVGGGGIGNRQIQNPLPAGYQGTPSYFGTPITSPGGGGGGVDDSASPFPSSTPGEQGMPGGSGGGNALDTSGLPSGGPATGSPFPGTIGATPTSGWGHPGGKGSRSPIGGAGGGGAGGAGSAPSPRTGGAGIKLPTTFRDPAQQIGAPGPTSAPTPNGFDTSGKYWVAGGGAGGGPAPTYSPTDGAASSGGGGYWSTPGSPTNPNQMIGAVQNTGSGGGAGSSSIPGEFAGASGIVIVAYPS